MSLVLLSVLLVACSSGSSTALTEGEGLDPETANSGRLSFELLSSGGQCLGVAGASEQAGAPVEQQACESSASQTWRIGYAGRGFSFTAQHSSQLMSSEDERKGARLVQLPKGDSPYQGYRLRYTRQGRSFKYRIISARTGQCLSAEPDGSVAQASCNRSDAQLFSLRRPVSRLPFEVRSLDGGGNNRASARLGEVGQAYPRLAAANYADGRSEMVKGPNERYISNRIFNDLAQNLFSETGVTQWGANWGQFLDHTFGLRELGKEPIRVPFDADDPLETFTNDSATLRDTRSAAMSGTGSSRPREQVNTVSSYIDAWAVYGGTDERLEWLREGPVDGDLSNNSAKFLTSDNDFLPRAVERGDAESAPTMELTGRLRVLEDAAERQIVAGDIRANENLALTAVHTLFMREHNRIVDELPKGLTESVKFEIARRVVGAQQQYITYTEFLPAFGLKLDRYRGYRANVDPSITNEFATVGYRAHSMIHGEIEMETEASRYSAGDLAAFRAQGIEVEVAGDEIELAVPLNIAFANPDLLPRLGLGPVLAGIGGEAQYKNDEQIDNQLRSVLFQIPNPDIENPDECLDGPTLNECFGLVADLGTIDVFRGRDHGMPYYNDLREAYGLKPVRSFAELTGEASEDFPADPEIDAEDPINDPDILDFLELRGLDGEIIEFGTDAAEGEAVEGTRRTPLAARLKAIYGSVDKVDAFVGMVSEPHLPGSDFGALQYATWKKQFEDLRDGDRFFYANDPALRWIKRKYGIDYRRTLAQIMIDNTDLSADDIQENMFVVPEE